MTGGSSTNIKRLMGSSFYYHDSCCIAYVAVLVSKHVAVLKYLYYVEVLMLLLVSRC